MIWNSFKVILQKNGIFLEQPHLLLATERKTKIVHCTDQSKKKIHSLWDEQIWKTDGIIKKIATEHGDAHSGLSFHQKRL